MNINERGKKYAEGKALSALNAAIEQAYIDGYNDGLKHLENEKLEAMKEGVEYVDLGLPSGTLWSSSYIKDERGVTRRIPFMDASQLSIPTWEDYKELCNECKLSHYSTKNLSGLKITGINGESIVIEYTYSDGSPWFDGCVKNYRFWLNESGVKDNEKKAARFLSRREGFLPGFFSMFMGDKLPIMLVKKKQD